MIIQIRIKEAWMIITLDGQSKRIRQWYKNHVYRMYNFRITFEQERDIADSKEKKRIRDKRDSLRKKVERHMNYGISLKIAESQMREFNLAIIDLVSKKKNPQAIIKELIKNGKK